PEYSTENPRPREPILRKSPARDPDPPKSCRLPPTTTPIHTGASDRPSLPRTAQLAEHSTSARTLPHSCSTSSCKGTPDSRCTSPIAARTPSRKNRNPQGDRPSVARK